MIGHRLAARRREAPREVIDVEALLAWALRAEYAHIHAESSGLYQGEAAAADLEPRGVSGDGCASLQRIAGLGCRPDGGLGHLGGHCHPDAETVYVAARRNLERPDFGLVVSYAQLGERPDWGQHIRELEARPVLTWELKVMVLRPRGSLGYCPVTFEERGADIAAHRMLYRAWWCALRRLCFALRLEDKLTRYKVFGPGAPEWPWHRGGAG